MIYTVILTYYNYIYNEVDLPADAQTFVRACFHWQPCKVILMLFNLFLILCILLNKGIKHTQLGLFNAKLFN